MKVILKKVNMDNYYLVSVVEGTSQERTGCGLLVECLLKAMISIPSFLKKNQDTDLYKTCFYL